MDPVIVAKFFQSLHTQYPKPYRYYLVLDGSRDDALYPQILDDGYQNSCLFKGRISEPLKSVAPHLIEFRNDSSYCLDWLTVICAQHWGLILITEVEFDILYQHLRHLIRIRHHQGMMVQFRFHDSFYLRPWLTSAPIEQQQAFFGPIVAIWGKGSEDYTLYRWHLDQLGHVDCQTIRLTLPLSLPKIKPLARQHVIRHQSNRVFTMEALQIEQMEAAILKQQCRQVHEYIEKQCPKWLVNKPYHQVMGQIVRVVERGRSYGFYDLNSLVWLTSTSFKVAAYFDTHPNINQLLRLKKNIHWLLKHSPPQDWEEAIHLTKPDGSHWV